MCGALPALPLRAPALQEEGDEGRERLPLGRAACLGGGAELGPHGGLDAAGAQGRSRQARELFRLSAAVDFYMYLYKDVLNIDLKSY